MNEEVLAKEFAKYIVENCTQETIENVIAKLAETILGEWGGNKESLMKEFFYGK